MLFRRTTAAACVFLVALAAGCASRSSPAKPDANALGTSKQGRPIAINPRKVFVPGPEGPPPPPVR